MSKKESLTKPSKESFKKQSISSKISSQKKNKNENTNRKSFYSISEYKTIHEELQWGAAYRALKSEINEEPLKPASSPISIHRLKKISKKIKLCTNPNCKCPLNVSKRKKLKKSKKIKCVRTTNLHAKPVDLLKRSLLNQNDYMKILAIPNIRCFNPDKIKKKHYSIKDYCSPRLLQLSVPNKYHVLCNWQRYQYFLPADFLTRYQNLLQTDQNTDLEQMRRYFKKIDKRKGRTSKIKPKEKKKQLRYKKWLNNQINVTTNLIVDYFIQEPPYELSFRQLLISSFIVEFLDKSGVVKDKLSRNEIKTFPLTIIEICDKISTWIDTVAKLVDFQSIDDVDDISSKTSSVVEDEEMFQYEEAEEEEGEEEGA